MPFGSPTLWLNQESYIDMISTDFHSEKKNNVQIQGRAGQLVYVLACACFYKKHLGHILCFCGLNKSICGFMLVCLCFIYLSLLWHILWHPNVLDTLVYVHHACETIYVLDSCLGSIRVRFLKRLDSFEDVNVSDNLTSLCPLNTVVFWVHVCSEGHTLPQTGAY